MNKINQTDQTKQVKIKKCGYWILIDKGDFDFVHFLNKELKPIEYYRDKIIEKYNDYFATIDISIFELSCFDNLIVDSMNLNEIESGDIIENELDKNPEWISRYCITKLVKDEKIKMPINKVNKLERMSDEWDRISQELFSYNGANFAVNVDILNQIKQFLKELEKEIN